jgi:hypothetical protein
MTTRTVIKTDTMWRNIRATQAASRAARDASGVEMVRVFTDAVDELTPKDTNRAANGWRDAARKAGLRDVQLLPLRPSKSRAKYLEQLEKQLNYFVAQVDRADSWIDKYDREDATRHSRRKKNGKLPKRRRSQPFYKKQKSIRRKAAKNAVRVAEELAKAEGSEHAIFFDAESYAQRRRNRAFTTVRDKVYGGDAEVHLDRARLIITLINREPHPRIIERHPHLGHPVATAKALARTRGVRAVSRRYRNELRERSPIGTKRAA